MSLDDRKYSPSDNTMPVGHETKKMTSYDNSRLDVREIQKDLLKKIKRAASQVDAKLVYADLVQTPRPLLWFCGSYEQVLAFQTLIAELQLGIAGVSGSKLIPFRPRLNIGYTGIVHANYVKNKVQIHGVTSGVEIEFCTWSDARQSWRAPRARIESEAEIGYFGSLDDFTFLDVTLPILRNAYEVWSYHPSRKKVDIVYTWVDGTDPEWLHRKSKISPNSTISGANGAARFESGSELLFSVISARRYFADLGNIYVVTDNQIPTILGDLLSEVTIVDHKDIFEDTNCLPTFNSHAIGAQLHNIPGLRQHYLYLNDDVLFGRPTSASTFYDEYGRSYQFLSTAVSTPHSKIGKLESAVDSAARNNRRLLKDKYGFFAFRKFKHTPIALDKNVMQSMRLELSEAWETTVGNKFRSDQDHSISGHLYAHYSAFKGRSVVGTISYGYFNIGDPDFIKKFRAVRRSDWAGLDTFCINEIDVTSKTETNRTHMDEELGKIFPTQGVVQLAAAEIEPRKINMTGKSAFRKLLHAILPQALQNKIHIFLVYMRTP